MTAIGFGGFVLNKGKLQYIELPEFPQSERLGRVIQGMVEIKSRPDENSQTVGRIYDDAVVPWLREIVGKKEFRTHKRWVETPDGYIYSPLLQPVANLPNSPVDSLIETSIGPGLWVEVTVPYVDIELVTGGSTPYFNNRLKEEGLPPRLYYGQVFWIDQIKKDNLGRSFYRVNPNYYGGLDILWAPAEAFRPILPEELEPINSEVEDKRIVIDVIHQTLSCFEGNSEVFFSRISSGAKIDEWATPLGLHQVTR